MPYAIIQAGDDLQFLNTDGELTNITLPTGITLATDRPPRWLVMNRYVILVNTPTRPVTIDGTGTVRPMAPLGPTTAPTVAAVSGGSLTGTYSGIRYSFIVRNLDGEIISESAMSPASEEVTVTNQAIKVSGIETSTEVITARRVYRTVDDGTSLFHWFDIEDNISTEFTSDTPDSGLGLIETPILGDPPSLTLIKEWRNRAWGVNPNNVDNLIFSQPGQWWAWPATNSIPVPIIGDDAIGIRALIPRREYLGIGKRDVIYQVSGETSANFRLVKLSALCGVESQETVVVYRDTAWWLWKDGVYQWDSTGINSITDGKVKSWFITDDYFNRDKFDSAFAIFDQDRLKYKLYLASAGSEVIDRWVEYDIRTKTWWGPHKTDAFSPTCAFYMYDSEEKLFPLIGSSEMYTWRENGNPHDHLATAIDWELITKFYDGGEPSAEKHWGMVTVLGKPQTAGQILVYPTAGWVGDSEQLPMTYNMSEGVESIGRIGRGKLMKLRMRHNTYNEPVRIYGLEVPFNVFGRR